MHLSCSEKICVSWILPKEKLSNVQFQKTTSFFLNVVQVDRSIVESFVQGGCMTVTSRVYPSVAVDKLANLYLFNNGLTPINVRSIAAYPMTQVAMYAI
jgi:beta-fructofuranosidase